jgi:hypothetical protein
MGRYYHSTKIRKEHQVDWEIWGDLRRAVCACGWRSQWVPHVRLAANAWREHAGMWDL